MKLLLALSYVCLTAVVFSVSAATTTMTTTASATTAREEATITTTSMSTSTATSSRDECVGNDSRCKGGTRTRCEALEAEGSDCRWQVHVEKNGTCSGNDSRCADSSHATCARLAAQGSDCYWQDPSWSSGASGKCVGNDSRCPASSAQGCNRLSQEGADCKWRAAFSVTGNMTLIISNVSRFLNSSLAQSAVANGLANVTVIPQEYADADLFAGVEGRRLEAQVIPDATSVNGGALTATYAISINGDAPASVTATGADVGNKLQATNADAIEAAISSSVAKSMGAGAFDISVQSVGVPLVVVAESPALSGANGVYNHLATYGSFLCVLAVSTLSVSQ